MHMCYSTFAEK